MPTESPEIFKHEPLDLSKRQIRLLRIEYVRHERGEGVLIRCQVKIFDLSNCPPYIALSYVWGSPLPVHTIMLNGKHFHIRQNLWYFLGNQRIQQKYSDSYWWIDQMCIDQENNQIEKNHQVAMMGQIFGGASKTVVWLGVPEKNDPNPSTYSDPVAKWIVRRYWTRLWVVQEIILSRTVELFDGNQPLNWGDFRFMKYSSSAWSKLPHPFNHIQSTVHALISIRSERATTPIKDFSLVKVIARFGHLDCADVRDKIFGLMSLIPSKATIPIDYSLSISELFQQVIVNGEKNPIKRSTMTLIKTPATIWDDDLWFYTKIRSLLGIDWKDMRTEDISALMRAFPKGAPGPDDP